MTPSIHHLTDTLIGVVGLPEDSSNFRMHEEIEDLFYDTKHAYDGESDWIALPQGNWSIIGWSDELTKFQKAEFFKDTDFVWYPEESFASLLRSHGIEGRALILRKIDLDERTRNVF